MKKMHAKRSWIFFMVLALVLVLGKTPVFAATEVSDFTGLKAAVERGDSSITITGDITVTETLEIKNNVTISGDKTLTAGNLITSDPNSGNIFYVNKGKTLKLDGVTLDGDNKARLIYSNGGKIELNKATLQKGYPGENAKTNPGGGVFLRGGSLMAQDTIFKNNTPGTNTSLAKGIGDKNGGAIYSGSTEADITITGGSFEGNEVKAYGHGAAIYQENGPLNVTGTHFSGNSGHYASDNEGTQGACIHTRDKVKATISNVDVKVARGFNTGGFLRSWGSTVKVSDSTFTIDRLGDNYGISGGVFCFEGGTSEVKESTFINQGEPNSKVSHAGGFIDIVGSGTHVIEGNTMTGRGNDNNSAIASFGGAISVEQGAKATVTIRDNTITNSTASDNGGAIAIGTYPDGKRPEPKPGEDPVPVKTPSEVTMIGNKIKNSGLIMWKGGTGGGVFVGPGAIVTMSGDEIKDTKAPYGGGVYNEGNLNISGGASLTGGIALSLGGEIYNNGDLTVDNATITGNFVGPANWNQTPGHEKKYEHGGTNIYAEKDVTITPNANITTGKDVRVLDGQSKILLTGSLTKEIDVSVSETPGGNETQKRRVGYVVAAGKDGYAVTRPDANFLHYIGRTNKEDSNHYSNQPRAAYADDKSTGEWDFVLDKDNKKVVLGQRVKLIYHGNLGTIGENDSEEKTVDVYKNPNFWKNQLEEYKVADPTLDGSSFMGWYFWKDGASARTTDDTIQNIKIPNDLKDKLFDFSRVTFKNNVKDTDQIITPNIIHTYAGWSQNISIPVLKEWVGAEEADKVDVTVILKGGDEEKTVKLTKANQYYDIFDNLPVFTKSYEPNEEKNMNLKFTPKTYSVEETPIDGFTTSYEPKNMVANEVAEISRFIVKNTKAKTGNVFVKYVAEDGTVLEAESKVVENEKVGTDYTTEQKTFDGYEYLAMGKGSAAASGKVVAGDLHVIYVYKAKTGNVFVKYVAEDGTVLEAESKVVENAKVGTDYTTEQKTFDGYEFSTMGEGSATATGKVVAGDLHVIYVYKAKTGNVFVKYVAEDGTVLEEESKVLEDAKVGTAYTTTQKTFDGYEFSKMGEDSAPANGTVEEGDLHVIYVYKKTEVTPQPKTGNVFVKYITEDGTVLEEESPVLENAKVGTAYTTTQKTFDGYEFSKMGENSAEPNGNVVAGDLHVIYVYKKAEAQPPTTKVTTQYVDENGNRLIPDREGKQPVVEIKDYTYLRTEESDTLIRHIYKKIQVPVHPSGSTLILPTPGMSEPVPDDGLLNKKDHKAYMFGYPDGNFLPERNMTREEATAMFARLLKDYPRERRSYNIPFKDVAESDWSQQAIGFMLEKGMIQGYEDGSFRPKADISRAEFAAMAARFDKLVAGGGNSFFDVPDTHWAVASIDSAAAKGWVTGYPDGSFKPERKITRAEVVNITNKMLDRFADRDFVRGHLSEMIQFKDLTEADWAYFPIMEATNGHDYTRKAAQEENWIRLNGEEFRFVVVGRK